MNFKTFAFLLLVQASQQQQQQCARITIRKEVNDLTAQEQQVYRETIRQAMRTPDPQQPQFSIWEAAAQLHNSQSGSIHGGGEFFFWHRFFLKTVEVKLQVLNEAFSFPYWNTSNEYAASTWHNSLALSLSDVSDVLDTRRKLEPYDMTIQQQWTNLLDQSIATGQGFNYWAPNPQAEYNHGTLHVNTGGRSAPFGEMAQMTAPRDPLFYMHHADMDLLWLQGQQQWIAKGLPQIGCPLVGNKGPSLLQSPLPGFDGKVLGDAIDTAALCVEYAPMGSTSSPTFRIVSTSTTSSAVVSKAAATLADSAFLSQGQEGPKAAEPDSKAVAQSSSSATASSATTTINSAPSSPTLPSGNITSCVPLPQAWMQMMNIQPQHVEEAVSRCQRVRSEVDAGKVFPTYPLTLVAPPPTGSAGALNNTGQTTGAPTGTLSTGAASAPTAGSSPSTTPASSLYSSSGGSTTSSLVTVVSFLLLSLCL